MRGIKLDAGKLDSPAVMIPAPVISLILVGAAYWLGKLLPIQAIQVEGELLRLLMGWGYNLTGLVIILTSMWLFRQHKTTINPARAATVMIEAGPYRYSRNPMYVGLALIHVGITIATGNLWQVVVMPIALLLIRWHVIAREERWLLKRFGESYYTYCQRVPRWF